MVCTTVQGTTHAGEAEAGVALARAGKFLATIAGILKAAKHFINTSGTKTSIATSLKMSAKTPSLDMFVAAIHEVREAVADSSYNITTARERLALTKGVNFDSQLVEKIRDLMIDIHNELHTTSGSFPEANTESEKKILMWQTMGFVEFKAFGKSKSNESMPAIKEHTASILRDKESEMDVGGSTTSQGEGRGKNIKPALNDTASDKGMSKEHDTVVEGVTIDKGEENQIESALNNVVNNESISKVHDMVVEGATIDKGKEKQIEPSLNDKVNGKGTRKVHDMLYDILVEGAATEEKQIKLILKDIVNTKGTSKVHDVLIGGATIDKGKEKQSEPVVEGPKKKKKKKKRKGKSKKNEMPTDNGKNDKGKSKENDDFVEASTLDKGKGKESELLIKGSATDEGKNKSNDDEADVSQESLDLIREAKDIVLEHISSDEDDEASRLIVEPDSTGQNAHRHEPMKVEARQEALMAFRKIHRLLKHAIRPQTAAPCELDLFCRFVEDPVFFGMMSETTEELRWNR